ncbi:BREX-1 system adenine-specific DNA-methyltransferase PglX [Aeromicrobium yanjiei]|uniref:site-specific DNA-methyltransferase (adenine-specific) n=1 Tax=Aeromicrobium yanjiei TaxID=2662028 RepID=A0A5Q2MN21_9ACTN|nr:BREX-1 system adenine-specific DNA-methyltransferase PglX [Aeromicrobium yanjiei]QGG41845.1 BREX-1 system adenine-specific DNA-methyltransferase PglX [Aeromicrobium yanjiei]
METAPLKSFATAARTELIREVGARITAVLAQGSPERVEQPKSVLALERTIAGAGGGDKGKAHVADKVAYTWFNRIIALRFMDANGYTGINVVSPATDQVGQPEVLAAAKRGQLDTNVVKGTSIATVTGLLNGTRQPRPGVDAQAEAYALLLADYCRFWNTAMPFMFEREGDYTELLIPANLLADDSVLSRSVTVLTEDVCKDVEVIGWLYQFYISERKDEVFAGFKKNKKAGADEIPAATQLFTPHWIVRYLVENSLGRLWMLNRPSSGLELQMDYYIAPVAAETDFLKISKPEELKVIDPACGSGHMLTYAFDLLYAIYEEEGYAPSEIPGLILANNLYGTEIDPRAGALAAFALTMKASAKRKLFLKSPVEPNVCVLEPAAFTDQELELLLTRSGDKAREEAFWNLFRHSDTLGALTEPNGLALAGAREHLATVDPEGDLFAGQVIERAQRVIAQAEYLTPRYSAVVANPPYMGTANMGDLLTNFAEENYGATRTDLYSMFMERAWRLTRPGGSWGVITPHGWMFQSSFADWRKRFLGRSRIATLTQFGRGVFGSDWASAAYVAVNVSPAADSHATYRKLFERALDVRSRDLLERLFLDPNYQRYVVRQDSFLRIDGAPIAFSLGQDVLDLLARATPLSRYASPKQGLITGDNDRFLRFWWEVSDRRVQFEGARGADVTDAQPWAPYLKGGPPRRWAGNELHVVRWARDGHEIRNFFGPNGRQRSRPQNTDFYFRPGLTWSTIAGEFAMRQADAGAIFDAKGSLLAVSDQANSPRLLGYLNSTLASRIITTLSPTLDFPQGPVGRIPVPDGVLSPSDADSMITECVQLSRRDWDASELSMTFVPRVGGQPESASLRHTVRAELTVAQADVDRMAELESKLDAHYSALVGDAGAHAASRSVTLNAFELLAMEPKVQDNAVVKDLISLAVGCMFGRYSLDKPGLILADQGTTSQDYVAKVPIPRFMPDEDNVIPIVDGDWFEDDVVGLFRRFLRTAFGDQHFEENLKFVTESLGVKNLRDYFITRAGRSKFYDDHVQRYKKRPIYWLFSSPKGSFNALIYMHRYTPSTVSTVLTYLREYVTKLESSLQQADRAGNAKEADRLRKILVELNEYEHDTLYPKASQNVVIDLDDGVKVNYPKFGTALKKITGLESSGG